LRIVDDQIGAPTPAAMISDVTGLVLAALRQGGQLPESVNLYHLAAANPVSWCAFARTIVTYAAETPGFSGMPAPEAITAITTADYPLPAARPTNSRLDCSRLEADFGLEMPDWQPYLQRMLQLLALKKANGY
jgi:dTDP-4-dehydrorhamnose reductase